MTTGELESLLTVSRASEHRLQSLSRQIDDRRAVMFALTNLGTILLQVASDDPGAIMRCGTEAIYGDADYFHRTVAWDREKVDI